MSETNTTARFRDTACEGCGREVEMMAEPHVRSFEVPFTRIEVQVWRWKDSLPWCEYCDGGRDDDAESLYQAVYDDGFEAGYKLGEREAGMWD